MNGDINIVVTAATGDALAGLKAVQSQVQGVGNRVNSATRTLQKHSAAYNSTAVATNKWAKGALQQAGFQVGDFVVQVQNGTNWLQAFGQQGSQLAGIFGPIGAVVGAGIAIFSSLAIVFNKASGSSKTFKDSLDELQDVSGELEKSLENVLMPLEELRKKYGESAMAAREFAIVQAQSSKILSQRMMLEQSAFLDDAIEKYGKATTVVSEFGESFDVSTQIRRVAKDFGIANMEAVKIQRAFERLYTADTFKAQSDALTALKADLDAVGVPLDKLPDDLLVMFRDMAKISQEQLWIEEMMRKIGQGVGGVITPIKDGVEDLTDTLEPLKQTTVDIGRAIQSSMSAALMSMVDGTKSVKDAFKDMARSIIMKLYEVLVVQRLVNGAMGILGGVFPGLQKFVPPGIGARAMGGPVTAGKPYLVGERGPELVVPGRNSQVVPNNQLGGGQVVVNQTINVSTGVQQTVRAEIKTLLPQIAEASKNAVLDARLRGGSYGRAFA